MYFLGIDGGGTKTTCLVTDENLNIVFRTVGSSINFYSEGLADARKNMQEMLRAIETEISVKHFDSVCIGSSALFTRADEKTMRAFCDGVFDADRIIMDSDLFIALKATKRENAAVVIAGTGSMAAGFGKNGKIVTRGGYGYILGDEGSGYAISLEAIKHAVRSLDNTGEKTVLGEYLLSFSGVSEKEQLVDAFYSPEKDRKAIAAFAPYVSRAVSEGDSVAKKIVDEQCRLLSETLRALTADMHEAPFVGLYGGIFQHDGYFRQQFISLISDCCSGAELLCHEPAFGACVAAKENTV